MRDVTLHSEVHADRGTAGDADGAGDRPDRDAHRQPLVKVAVVTLLVVAFADPANGA